MGNGNLGAWLRPACNDCITGRFYPYCIKGWNGQFFGGCCLWNLCGFGNSHSLRGFGCFFHLGRLWCFGCFFGFRRFLNFWRLGHGCGFHVGNGGFDPKPFFPLRICQYGKTDNYEGSECHYGISLWLIFFRHDK